MATPPIHLPQSVIKINKKGVEVISSVIYSGEKLRNGLTYADLAKGKVAADPRDKVLPPLRQNTDKPKALTLDKLTKTNTTETGTPSANGEV